MAVEIPAVKSRMTKQHPEYVRLRPSYDFLRAAYLGGTTYIRSNIFRHEPRESASDYKRRLERAVYPNYVRSVIRAYRDHVFRHEDGISRPDGDQAYIEWTDDVNRRGQEANAFWGGVLTRALLYGWSAVLVDMPKPREDVQTLADQQAVGDMPYLVHVSPRQIVDWNLDDLGRFRWIRIEEQYAEATTPLGDRESKKRWRIWTRDDWSLIDEDGNTVDGGTNPLSEVPVVLIRVEPPEEDDTLNELAGTSFMLDFARINRMLANKVSEVDGFLAKNMLQILTVAETAMSVMSGQADETATLKDGSMIGYPAEADAPSFIAPDVTGASQVFDHIQMLRWELFRLATQKDVTSSEGRRQEQSGVAKMVDFEEQNAVLSGLADRLQVAEQGATRLWYAWQGQNPKADEEIDYPDNYNLRSLQDDIGIAVQVRDVYGSASPTLMSSYLFSLARRITDDMTDAEARIVQDELLANLQNASDQVNALGRVAQEAVPPPPVVGAPSDPDIV